jgi:hypothetical protein
MLKVPGVMFPNFTSLSTLAHFQLLIFINTFVIKQHTIYLYINYSKWIAERDVAHAV